MSVGRQLRGSVALPARLGERVSSEDPFFVLRARVELPQAMRGRNLTLSATSWMGAATARAGDRDLERVDEHPSNGYRAVGPQVWSVPAGVATATLDLELRVANTFTRSAWLTSVPTLSTRERGTAAAALVDGCKRASLLGVCALATVAVIFLLLYAMDPEGRWRVWVACACAAAAYSLLFSLGVTEALGPRLEAPALAIAYATAVVLSIRAEHAYFELPPPSPFWGASWVALAVLSVLLSSPFMATRYLAPLMAVFLAIGVAGHLRLYLRMAGDSPEATPAAIARWVLIATAMVLDGLPWFGVEPLGGARVAPAALFAFGLLLLASLCRELVARTRAAEKLSVDVDDLNGEVRRLVSERSRALSQALARMSTSDGVSQELAPGTVVDDRYSVVSVIGGGAMGRVFHVVRERDGRPLAMKVLRDQRDPASSARFAREAQLAARVDHPNVVEVVDAHVDESGILFLIMEYVLGPSLLYAMEEIRGGDNELLVLRDIVGALGYVHASGIVHRDLKPGNVLLSKKPGGRVTPKLADFGISALVPDHRAATGARLGTPAPLDADTGRATLVRPERSGVSEFELGPDITQTGVVLGTPGYLAPELLGGAPATPASDMFSFGILARQLLADLRPGPPVAGPQPVRLAGLRADLPLALVTLIDACCFPDASARPTANAMHAALERAIELGGAPAGAQAPSRGRRLSWRPGRRNRR